MADTALNIPDATMAAAFENIYKSIPRQTITPAAITLDAKTRESLASEIDASLRPYMDMAAAQRQQAAVQSRAELDADANSRGMGSSTWLTDKKSRESMAAQSDIANIKAQYGASLIGGVNDQMQNYTANKLAVDQANVSNKLAADQFNASQEEQAYQKAYSIFMDMWNKGMFALPSTGGGTTTDPTKDGWYGDSSIAEQVLNATARSAAAMATYDTQKAIGDPSWRPSR